MKLPTRYRRGAALLLAVGVLGALAVLLVGRESAAVGPCVPEADAVVLERVAAAPSRALLEENPRDVSRAVAYARENIDTARRESDPRFLGRAQAALGPWWNDPEAPAQVILLRATIRQSLHEFEPALADLDLLARRVPDEPQVWLTRGTVLAVRGRYEEARESCAELPRLAPAWVGATCSASIDSQSGHAKEGLATLTDALRRDAPKDPAATAWTLSTLGEVAMRAGEDGVAELDYVRAILADPGDVYTRAALADLLLDRDRPSDVLGLLAGTEKDDGLLLRLAIAETKTKASAAAEHVATLRARHQASRARGDVVHRREQARFELAFGSPRLALDLARANWDVQREAWDARVLLEAAIASDDLEAARPVRAFIRASGLEEPRLLALAARASDGDR
jgi:predicted Zn-dependent protease